ncbi:MAG TPA: hypothetical protein VFS00_05900, partial [Polyangiaceae bacterium]|nr:hypothetical protein [Polyangiaceae bacterium]
TDETGVCKARPVGCTKEYDPVCSCNGVFSNECTANAAGYDVNSAGQCAPPANPPAVQRR